MIEWKHLFIRPESVDMLVYNDTSAYNSVGIFLEHRPAGIHINCTEREYRELKALIQRALEPIVTSDGHAAVAEVSDGKV